MKRTFIALALLGGVLLGGSPAQATTCQPAYDETVVDTPAQAAVTKTQYEFSHTDQGNENSAQTRWEDDPNWNAESNPHSQGWVATGNTRVVEVTPAQAEVSHVVHHPANCPKPDPVVTVERVPDYDCGDAYSTVTIITTTTDWVLDGNTWVKGEPQVKYTYEYPSHQVINCLTEKPEKPVVDKPVVERQPGRTQVLPDTGAPTLLWGVLGSVLLLAGASVLLLGRVKE